MLHDLSMTPDQLDSLRRWADTSPSMASILLAAHDDYDGERVIVAQQGDDRQAFAEAGDHLDPNRILLAEALTAFKTATAALEAVWDACPDDAISGSPMDFRELAAAVADMTMVLEPPRLTRLQKVYDRHPQDDDFNPVILDTLRGEIDCPRYAGVVRRDDHETAAHPFAIGLHDTLSASLSFMGCDAPEWEPYALYDLDTGRSLPLNITTVVTIPDDEHATCEPDLED